MDFLGALEKQESPPAEQNQVTPGETVADQAYNRLSEVDKPNDRPQQCEARC
jgi:hypothetical protein